MEQYIVAIDPGTSKMVAMIARKDAGKVSVLRTEKVDSENCIRRGCIYNVDAAAEKINHLINRLNSDYARPKLRAPIERVYVSIGGQSLHTECYSIKRKVEAGLIDQPLLNSIKEEIEQYKPELYEVLKILPPEYYVDEQLNPSPRGTTASVIEARYQLIVVSNPNLKKLLRKAIPENIEIEEYVVSPLATAAAVLENKEKDLGCALVELGAGVTYVSVYKSGILRYLVTIPLGGLTITKDICCLNVSEEEAENLKKNHGSAILDSEDMRKITIDEGLSTEREIKIKDLNTIIEARIDEILENVMHQIQESGYGEKLGSGIVFTGGGAMLRNLEEFFRNKMNKNLRIAYPVATETNQPAEYSTIIGLLTLAKEESVSPTKKEPVPPSPPRIKKEEKKDEEIPTPGEATGGNNITDKGPIRKGGIFTKIKKGFNSLQKEIFEEEDDDNDNNKK